MNDSPVLRASELHKNYRIGGGELEVLRGVSLSLVRGQTAALRGASGSGKSTLLHLLGLLDRPDRGAVELAGRDTAQLGPTARARLRAEWVGFVFQQFHLLPELSALENVLVPRRLARAGWWWSRRHAERERAHAALAAVGLEERLRHRPAQLSGGEQQRVAIARALVSDPPILLADEPTGNLDRRTGEEVLELMLALARERGTAVLLATHDSEIAGRCGQTLELADGLIECP